MIEQWFDAMNDTLDELLSRYPKASDQEKKDLTEQWNVLKSISDDIIEAWLRFEDKMALFRTLTQEHDIAAQAHDYSDVLMGPYVKGQGYFKLQMFRDAAGQFEETLRLEPELNAARLFLAMCRMHLGHFPEAQRHFQLIAALADEAKLRAIAYNALGCIQAVGANLKLAESYFRQAAETDPTFEDPKRNLESCRSLSATGPLKLQFGSSEMQTLVMT